MEESSVPGLIYRLLAEDHRRLDDLLARTTVRPDTLDLGAYREFRAGLLRHIGMEEKILIPWAQRARGGRPLPIAFRLRLDHGALAALLVPPPSRDIIAAIRAILSGHNPLEEGTGGLYAACEQLAGDRTETLAERLRNAPYSRLKPNVSSPTVLEAARLALGRAGYDWDELVRRGGIEQRGSRRKPG